MCNFDMTWCAISTWPDVQFRHDLMCNFDMTWCAISTWPDVQFRHDLMCNFDMTWCAISTWPMTFMTFIYVMIIGHAPCEHPIYVKTQFHKRSQICKRHIYLRVYIYILLIEYGIHSRLHCTNVVNALTNALSDTYANDCICRTPFSVEICQEGLVVW